MTPTAHALPSPQTRALRLQSLALGQHLQQCKLARGRWFDAALLAEQAHRQIAPRFVTTVVVVTVVLAVSLGWL